MITVIAVMCHMIAPISAPVCREEIVVQREMSMMMCKMGWPQAVAEWKGNSKFAGDQWTVGEVRCIPGSDYVPRDAI